MPTSKKSEKLRALLLYQLSKLTQQHCLYFFRFFTGWHLKLRFVIKLSKSSNSDLPRRYHKMRYLVFFKSTFTELGLPKSYLLASLSKKGFVRPNLVIGVKTWRPERDKSKSCRLWLWSKMRSLIRSEVVRIGDRDCCSSVLRYSKERLELKTFF